MKKIYSKALAALFLTVPALAAAIPPDEPSTMKEYTLSPADEETVTELETIIIDFTQDKVDGIECGIMSESYSKYVTLTCGEKVYGAKNVKAGYNGDYDKGVITFDKITQPGEYTLNIAESTFYDFARAEQSEDEDRFDGNPEITAKYIIKGAEAPTSPMAAYTIDPADGQTVESLASIKIAFTGVNEIDQDTPIYATIKKDGQTVATATDFDYTGDNSIDINQWNASVTEPGTYVFTLPAGSFYDFDNESDLNPEITATYVIKGDEPAEPTMTNYTLDPADGDEIEMIDCVTVAFPDATEVEPADNADQIVIRKDGVVVATYDDCEPNAEIENGMIIYFDEPIEDEGEYTLEIPAGAFKDLANGSLNEAISAKYIVKAAEIPVGSMSTYTLDPADGQTVETIKEVTVAFPETAEGVDEYGSKSGIVIKQGDKVVATCSTWVNGGDNYESFRLIFDNEIKEKGVYTLVIPADTFKDYSTEGDNVVTNPEITATYNVIGESGIDSIEADNNAGVEIYNLQGVRVATDSQNLPAGLYIVNGKKQIIKK